MDNKYIGSLIKELRLKKGFTQGQLGDMVGKTNESIKKYESGYTTIPIDVLSNIANALDHELIIKFKQKNKG